MDEVEPSDVMDLDSDFDLLWGYADEVPPSPLARSPIITRRKWGTGEEAALTAPYRSYDLSQSPIFRLFRSHISNLSIEVLSSLFQSVRESVPEDNRPKVPSRTQKRVKSGSICWLDMHWNIAMSYVMSWKVGNKD
jgi:hypothetical protein